MPIESRPIETVFASTAPGAEVINFPDWGRGWGLTFDPGQTEGVPPMEWFNSAFQIINKGMRYLVQRGISEWTSTETYPQHGLCQYGGSFYYAKVASTNQVPNPAAETTYWRKTMLTAADLGTMAVQNADAVNITGGSATLGDLAVSKQVTGSVHPVSITNTSTAALSGVALYLQKGVGGANGRGGMNYVPGTAMKIGTLANDAAASVSLSVNNTDKVTATSTSIALNDDTTVTGALSVVGNSLLNGNLTLIGTGRRIQADFSNATASNRTWLQSSTLNGATVVGIMPNGSNISSGLTLSSSSDVLNASIGAVSLDTSSYRINSSYTGTGSLLPLDIQMFGTTAMRVHTNRNVRVGASPTTDTGYTLQVGGTFQVSGSAEFSSGAFIADRNFSTKAYAVAAGAWVTIELNSDGGTTLVAGKNYVVSVVAANTGSTASAAKYLVYQTGASAWAVRLVSASSPGSTSTPQPAVRVSGTAVQISHSHTGSSYNLQASVEQRTTGNGTLTDLGYFGNESAVSVIGDRVLIGATAQSNGTDKLQVTGGVTISGNVGIGGPSTSSASLTIPSNVTGAATALGVYHSGIVQSDVSTYFGFRNDLNTAAASFTVANAYGFFARAQALGAGSAVTNNHGFYVDSTFAVGGLNYGYYGQVAASGTSNWNLYMNGSAPNYLSGALGIGSNVSLGPVTLRVSRNLTGSTITYNALFEGVVQSDVTSTVYGVQSRLNTAAAAFTLNSHIHYSATRISIGSGSVVTNQNGFYVDSAMTGATNNYGFRGLLNAASGSWNLYMDGTAKNYLAGNLLLGSTTDDGVNKLQVTGSANFTGAVETDASLRVVSNGFTTILSNLADGASLSTTGTSNSLQFYTNSTLRFKILTDGSLVTGGLAQSIGGAAAQLTLAYTGAATNIGIVMKANSSNDAVANTAISFLRASTNTTTGTIEQKAAGAGLLLTGIWSVAAPADTNRSDRIPSTQWVANNFSKSGSLAGNNISENNINGTIIKHARVTLGDLPAGGLTGTFNWPTAFPNECEAVHVTVIDSSTNRNVFAGVQSSTAASVVYWVNETSAAGQNVTLQITAYGR